MGAEPKLARRRRGEADGRMLRGLLFSPVGPEIVGSFRRVDIVVTNADFHYDASYLIILISGGKHSVRQ